MRLMDLEQTADYLEEATIEWTREEGHAIIHAGRDAFGRRFVLVNNCRGESVVTESL